MPSIIPAVDPARIDSQETGPKAGDAPPRIVVGIGACLTGQPVRYNGSHKKGSDVLDRLATCFDFRPFCPEVAIGLGVPRPTIRLVGPAGETVDQSRLRAVDSDTGQHDVSAPLRAYGERIAREHDELCGYVLVKGSPSCGYERVKRYSEQGHMQPADATGLFAAALMAANPLLPVEDDGRLHDDRLCESFVARVYTYAQWRQLLSSKGKSDEGKASDGQGSGLTYPALQAFYSRHKYLVMSRDVSIYRALGRLLADARREPLDTLAPQVIALILEALKKPATRRGHTNALEHIRGYLKRKISADEKQELGAVIEQYRQGVVPLVVPLTLLRHFFRRYPDAYIEQQSFMQPYPEALRLRNAL